MNIVIVILHCVIFHLHVSTIYSVDTNMVDGISQNDIRNMYVINQCPLNNTACISHTCNYNIVKDVS